MKLRNTVKTAGTVALGAVLAVAAGTAAKADYPEKPIKLYVGFSAGGGTDTSARGFASYVHEIEGMNGMPMVVVNKPGGSGQQAAKIVKDSKPDGYTLYIINSGTFAAADMSRKNAPAKPLQDFDNLGCMTRLVTSMQVHASSPHQDAASWVKAMKDSGKEVKWATSGAATMHALLGHLFLGEVGLKNKKIPFKGGSKARGALVAQKVDVGFNGVHLTSGFENDIRNLGVPLDERDPANKNVPTFKEQGLPGLNLAGAMCLWGPKGMPEDVKAKLAGAVKGVSELKGFGRFMKKSALAALYLTPEQGTQGIQDLYDKLGPIVAQYKLQK